MKNKINKNSKVVSINNEISEYQSAIDLFRNYPTMPTYCFMLEKALSAKVNIEDLKSELKKLFKVSRDQFYCFRGSEFIKKNSRLLRHANLNYPDSASSVEICKILWSIFERYKSNDIYGYENYLVGDADYSFLTYEDQKYNENTITINPSVSEERSDLAQLAYDAASAFVELDKSARSIHQEAEKLGFNMIPWSAWATDILDKRPELKAGLSDFSEYLSSYFVEETSAYDFQENDESLKFLEAKNSKSLLEISSFLIFYPLINKNQSENNIVNFEDFWIERLVNYSSINSYLEHEDKSEYLISISNFLMMCAKFGINSVQDDLVTLDELKRKHLSCCTSEYFDSACLALLPANGFLQIIPSISPFDGDREDDYFLDDILRVTDYGVNGSPNSRHLDKLYESGFSGFNDEIINFLKNKTEENVKNWMIPLDKIGYLHHIYKDFWNDDVILDKIAESLTYADRDSKYKCKFSFDDIDEATWHPDVYDASHHPAMFARKFSNKVDFLNFQDEEWISFAKSLNFAGQKRFLCILIALYFTRAGYLKFYNVKNNNNIDVPAWIKLLQIVHPLNSFKIVQQSIADMFELYENIPINFKGSFQEFRTGSNSDVLSIDNKDSDRFSLYKNNLLSTGLMLDKLSVDSQKSLVKGYTLTRDKDLAVFELNSAALHNYFLAIEGELRSRICNLDSQLIEELQYFNIEINQIKNINSKIKIGHIKGLFGIILLIDNFTKLSESSRRKLIKIAPLSVHEDCALFLKSLSEFKNIRNPVQHGDQSTLSSTDSLNLVSKVEILLFGEGRIVDILCKTKKY
jgi:hypothetical protein